MTVPAEALPPLLSPAEVGWRVREARERAGLSQAEVCAVLAERYGLTIHRPGFTRIEAGRRGLSAREVDALAEVFAVPIRALTRGEGGAAGSGGAE